MFDGSESSTELLNHMYPLGIDEETSLPLKADEIIVRLKAQKKKRKKLMNELKRMKTNSNPC